MPPPPPSPDHHHNNNHLNHFIHSATTTFLSLLTPKPLSPPPPFRSNLFVPFPLSSSTSNPFFNLSAQNSSSSSEKDGDRARPESLSSSAAAATNGGGEGGSSSDVMALSRVRFAGATGILKGGGPAFVGHVYTMCDRESGSLMATYDDFDFSFLPLRAAAMVKKAIRVISKSDDHHIFRFFMDLGDAVSYVRRLNPPGGVVGACPLDLAYRYFKEQSHHFQFIPNKKQVKAANKLLKELPTGEASRTVDGVPVFAAQNLDVVIASRHGINRYTPYFFNKEVLDNILEESADRHFHSLIEVRHLQRQQDVNDDSIPSESIEESGDDIWEPTEVEDLLDDMVADVLLGAVSKVAQTQVMHAVDKLLLGNRWLRKATGIQPKFPYVVDSFEKRSAASFLRASQSLKEIDGELVEPALSSKKEVKDESEAASVPQPDFSFPFGDWSKHPLPTPFDEPKNSVDSRTVGSKCQKNNTQQSVLLPKITMVGMPDAEPGDMATKMTMEKLKKELEQESPFYDADNKQYTYPLFVANVEDIYTDIGEVRFGSKGSRRKQLKKKA